MVNAGAIAVAELMDGNTAEERVANMLALFSSLGGRRLAIDEAVYRSEHATGHRNRAIAYMMLNTSMLERDPNEVLDLYFRQCSVKITARDLAIMAATLANDGRNPITSEIVYGAQCVRDVLTVMNSCGMYNYAGQWSYEVGMPAKSGVSGCILAVIPGQIGIGVYSPPIDALGNSVRGIRVCEEISKEFDLHVFNNRTNVRTHPARISRRRGEVQSPAHAGRAARVGGRGPRSCGAGNTGRIVLRFDGALLAAARPTGRRDALCDCRFEARASCRYGGRAADRPRRAHHGRRGVRACFRRDCRGRAACVARGSAQRAGGEAHGPLLQGHRRGA